MAKKLIKDSTLTAIADAIRDKGGASGPMTPQDMPAKIAAIPTEGGGSGGIDTSDATATASDLAKDKTAYVNGEKVTGTIPETASGEVLLKTINKTTENDLAIQHSHTLTEDALLRAGSIFRIGMTKASYGNATAADVLNGKTFTGADGFKKTGTLVPETGPTYDVDQEIASGNASNLNFVDMSMVANEVCIEGEFAQNVLQHEGSKADVWVPASEFGTAGITQVAKGVTFTSQNGIKKTGTYEPPTLASQTPANATAADIAGGKTAWVNGAKVEGTGNMGVYHEETLNLPYWEWVNTIQIDATKKYGFFALCTDTETYFSHGFIENGTLVKSYGNKVNSRIQGGILQLYNNASDTFPNYLLKIVGV